MTQRTFIAAPKRSDEISAHGINVADVLVLLGEIAATVTVRVYDFSNPGVEVTDWMLVPGTETLSDNVATFQVQNGSDNATYAAVLFLSTDEDRVEAGTVILPVRNRPFA